MLAGRAAILGILRTLRHFAVGDLVDQLGAQRLLVERYRRRAVAAKGDVRT
jgi:hypothetical protein